jgi:hypothetical protein
MGPGPWWLHVIVIVTVSALTVIISRNLQERKARKKRQIQELRRLLAEPSEEQVLRDKISSLLCVRAGWSFGVPEDGRDEWLDLVVKAVMRKNS